MQLFVRSNTGRTFVVALDRHATIDTVASLCTEQEELLQCSDAKVSSPSSSIATWLTTPAAATTTDRFLCYGGVPLRSQRTLEDYGIQNHATLEYISRRRGGCFVFSITLWIIIFVCFLLSICTCGLSLPIALSLIPIALLLPLCCL